MFYQTRQALLNTILCFYIYKFFYMPNFQFGTPFMPVFSIGLYF
ncbi:Uncharacterized protein dnl_23730 [Desulfonema limicola]|uniref:Uncharacterized protein n=1 Tax=Desulfonema limicola TaxID=45656 RepID=A0A975B785_9BACT|nr:Uncharacterized protein dnl_23730 [Desulfonema limicola]